MPPIELEHSYNYHLQRHSPKTSRDDYGRTAELMSIDSWLSLAGRLSEIVNGRSNLIRATSARIEMLTADFKEDFRAVDLSAAEGSLQLLQDSLGNPMDVVKDDGLSQAEHLLTMVAILQIAETAL